MSNLRRYDSFGKPYYLTIVTYNRESILIDNESLLLQTLQNSMHRFRVGIRAWVILPDHFHVLVDIRDNITIAQIMHFIKQSFSIKYRHKLKIKTGRVWQYRFWDHIIRNDDDLRRHIDYIHYNPVKHNLCNSPFDYQFTSIHDYRKYYQPDWGCTEPGHIGGVKGE